LAHAPKLLPWVNTHVKGAHYATVGGAFLPLTLNEAMTLIDKMVV
jgi:hypothetical protein